VARGDRVGDTVRVRTARPVRRAALAAAAGAAVLLSGCAGDDAGRASEPLERPAAADSGVRAVDPGAGLRLTARQDAVVLDVRTPEEFGDGHLEGARNLPLADDFAAAVARLPRDGSYVLYCRTGNRSAQAAQIMAGLGFTDVADAGGLDALAAAGGRVVS
jgi:phage shock protein E